MLRNFGSVRLKAFLANREPNLRFSSGIWSNHELNCGVQFRFEPQPYKGIFCTNDVNLKLTVQNNQDAVPDPRIDAGDTWSCVTAANLGFLSEADVPVDVKHRWSTNPQ